MKKYNRGSIDQSLIHNIIINIIVIAINVMIIILIIIIITIIVFTNHHRLHNYCKIQLPFHSSVPNTIVNRYMMAASNRGVQAQVSSLLHAVKVSTLKLH